MRFLTTGEIRQLHDVAIDEYGGMPGIRDDGGVAAVCDGAKTASKYADDIFDVAAAYILYINQRHPFVDGNKRTSFAATVRFLSWNGVATGHSGKALGEIVLGVATGTNQVSRERVADMLRELFA